MESAVAARTAILMSLIRGKSFGLEIVDRVRESTNGTVKLRFGSIYPKLREMEVDGLVTSWDEPGPTSRGGRPRHYYQLTAAGLRAAREQSKTLVGLLQLAEVRS